MSAAMHGAVHGACERELAALRAQGLPAPALRGQLIRPLLGLAGVVGDPHPRAAAAWLAVQLAHEASLLHDDVIDGAVRRRGEPTVAAARGVAVALVEGDHLLTTGYRVAASTASLAFIELYARAVERTVAGERRQNERRGTPLDMDEYEAIVLGKSGELIGCAFAADAVLRADPRSEQFLEVGRRIGVCYQMVDDLLDYCTVAASGKEPFSDYRQRLWTWPLALLPGSTWPASQAELTGLLGTPDASGRTVLMRAFEELQVGFGGVRRDVLRLLPADTIVASLFADWLGRVESAVKRSAVIAAEPAPAIRIVPADPPLQAAAEAVEAPVLPPAAELERFFAQNSRSFSFAARFFPAAERARVADVYAFCRVTDDLVDSAPAAADAERRLRAWTVLCRLAYERGATGLPTLDRVLQHAARAGVPFAYIEELIAGMRMDLAPRRYESLAELRTYTHRVASVVGLWLTRLWGVHDPLVLARAADLGHAMQLTNILRDVGEDWRMGRLYLPRQLLERHRVDEALIARLCAGEAPPRRYRALLEDLMAVADAYYQRAFEAIPSLPPHARRAVAVAAGVYRGIHDEIRANGFDNLTRRAHTSWPRKLVLAARSLWRLRRLRGRGAQRLAVLGRSAALALALLASGAGAAAAQESTAAHLAAVEARIADLPGDSLLRLERVRALYFVAVEQERQLRAALASVEAVRRDYPGMAAHHASLLLAYDGALELLRAKHGTWPVARWKAARRGLRMLDDAIAAAPHDPEIRYLRLINVHYLPGIFGRGDSAQDDFDALAELLPRVGDRYPRAFVRDVARFVLAHARLDVAARARLEAWEGSDG